MNKKVLIIKGSSRKDSFTNQLWQEAIETISNIEVIVYDACSEKFNFCNGCNYCEDNGKCVHRDLDDFYETFENASADSIIVGNNSGSVSISQEENCKKI